MAEEHIGLPENARRELKPGEKYVPIVPSREAMPEVTTRSVLLGILMCVVFSAAITYLTLKIGTGLEAAIPISILAVGISYLFKRHSTILENVFIIAIGATSGIVAGGAVFVLPALYVMGLDQHTNLFQLFFIPFLGSTLGVMLLIPLRRYFVADMHGKFPFPEATATTEVLVAGKKGGRDAIVLAYTMLIGAVYDFFAVSLHAWRETFSTDLIKVFMPLTMKFKAVFSTSTTAAITAMGYIVGIRYCLMMAAGGILSTLILVPLIAYFGDIGGGTKFAEMAAGDIYSNYSRLIGIGAIFMAGIIAIIKFIPIIYKSTVGGLKEAILSRQRHADERVVERTERDIPMSIVIPVAIVTLIGIWLYFRYSVLAGQANPVVLAFIGLAATFLLAFLFNSVSAYAIATISITPISGMTMLTLLITSIVMKKAGLVDKEGMVATLLVGGVVCTALSMSGSLITQMKISYWIGATPKKLQWANVFGSIIAAVITAAIIVVLAKVYGFSPTPEHPRPLPAPQANAMAAVIGSIMSTGAPWFLYLVGAGIAILMEMLKVSPLAFAMGMYLPLEINFPMLIGASVAWLVTKSARDEKTGARYYERGTLVSSGLVAGAAIMGVISSLIQWAEQEKGLSILHNFNNTGYIGNWLGLIMLIILCAYMFWDSRRVREL